MSHSKVIFAALVFLFISVAHAQEKNVTPVASGGQFSQPLESPELEDGVLTVKITGGAMTETKPGIPVELFSLDGETAKKITAAPTGPDGRARFEKLSAGQIYRVAVKLGSELIASQPFAMTPQGGLRLLLTLGHDPAMAMHPTMTPPHTNAKLPSTKDLNVLELAEGSQWVMQTNEHSVSFMQLLTIKNVSEKLFVPEGKMLFLPLPARATNIELPEEYKTFAAIDAQKIALQLTSPLMPGTTMLRIFFEIPFSGKELDFRQELPLKLSPSTIVIVGKNAASLVLSGPAISSGPSPIEGKPEHRGYPLAAKPANSFLEFTISGLPQADTRLRDLMLVLAALIALWGITASITAWRRRHPRVTKDK